MKSVINSSHLHKETTQNTDYEKLEKTLKHLQQQNQQCETLATNYENQCTTLEADNIKFEQQIKQKMHYLQMLKKEIQMQSCQCEGQCHCANMDEQVNQEQKSNNQQEYDMEGWMEQAQQYSGLPQEHIDSLLEMQYEGSDEQQICLSCYQTMQMGVKSKYLPCSHIFHSQCINNHLKVNKVCPACEEVVVVM